jgi:hypothetical protein
LYSCRMSIIFSVSTSFFFFLSVVLSEYNGFLFFFFFFWESLKELLFHLLGIPEAIASLKDDFVFLHVQCSQAEADKSQVLYLSRKPFSPLSLEIWADQPLFALNSSSVELSCQMSNYCQRKIYIISVLNSLQMCLFAVNWGLVRTTDI